MRPRAPRRARAASWWRWIRARCARRPAPGWSCPARRWPELVASEWAAQQEVVDHGQMPATRLAFTAADRIGEARVATAAEIARQAGADQLCYFAEAPRALTERQEARWGPVLDWAAQALELRFERASGILHRAQPQTTLDRVEALALALDDFALAGLALAAGPVRIGDPRLGAAARRAERRRSLRPLSPGRGLPGGAVGH